MVAIVALLVEINVEIFNDAGSLPFARAPTGFSVLVGPLFRATLLLERARIPRGTQRNQISMQIASVEPRQ